MGTQYRLSFNAGEITPELAWRNDLAKFQNGCRELSNFLVTPYGAVKRRPSTVGLRTLAGLMEGYEHRIFSWASNSSYRFAVVVGVFGTTNSNQTCMFVVPETGGVPFSPSSIHAPDSVFNVIPCPWPKTALNLLQAIQINDVMFFAHPEVPPMRLENHAGTWVFKEHECFGGPFLNGEEESRTASVTKSYLYDGVAVGEWSPASVAYVVGNAVRYGSKTWVCILNHTSSDSSSYEPDYSSSTRWRLVLDDNALWAARAAWVYPFAYNVGAIVTFEGATYVCQSNHTSSMIYEPDETSKWKRCSDTAAVVKWKLSFSGDVFVVADSANYVGAPWAVLANDNKSVVMKNWITASYDGANVGELVGTTAEVGDVSESILATGVVQLTTSGVWAGELSLEESTDKGKTWVELGVIASNASAVSNGSLEREITAKVSRVRVRLKSRSCAARDFIRDYDRNKLITPSDNNGNNLPPSDTGCAFTLKRIGETWLYGKIESVIDAKSAYFVPAAESIDEVNNSPRWSEGLFSKRNGYPRSLSVYQERLFFGGNLRRPQSVWASAVNDWTDFRLGTLDTAALAFTLAADRMHAIRWLRSGKVLQIGTDSGEWTMTELNKQEALTGSNVSVTCNTEFGSSTIAACAMSDVVVFVQRNGQRLRSMLYDYQTDGFIAPDLSMLGKHLLTGGVRQLAFQRHPYPILWLLLADGTMASFTYDRENDVLGWARHSLPWVVRAIAVQPGATDDELWLLAKNVSSGDVKLCSMRPTYNVSGNEVHFDLATYANNAWSGTAFVSTMEPTGMAAPDGQHGKRSLITGARLFVYGSAAAEVSADGGAIWEPYSSTGTGNEQWKLFANSGWGESVNVKVRSVSSNPLTVCALGVEIERGEK